MSSNWHYFYGRATFFYVARDIEEKNISSITGRWAVGPFFLRPSAYLPIILDILLSFLHLSRSGARRHPIGNFLCSLNFLGSVASMFDYLPDEDTQQRAFNWFKYGVNPRTAEQQAMRGFEVQNFAQNLETAEHERNELDWEVQKMTARGFGMWADDYPDRRARCLHLTDAHMAQALADDSGRLTHCRLTHLSSHEVPNVLQNNTIFYPRFMYAQVFIKCP